MEGAIAAGVTAKILAVDDDQRNLLALQELLQAPGQTLVLASSGEEALRRVEREEFAVILLDARMPGMDGFATARRIRERPGPRHTPIIFLTAAYEDVGSIFRGYEVGAVDYIVKPLIPEVLKSKIAVFVDLYNKNAALTREVAERRVTEERLRESEENLRALAAHLQSVREEEQIRIAREIHDELGQALTGLKMDLTWLAGGLRAEQKGLIEKTTAMFRLIDGTIRSVRRIASGLRPEVLDEIGLAAAISWQARDFQVRSGIRCKVDLLADGLELDQARSTAAFRIFQEVLTNVARHAHATRVEVRMGVEADMLWLKVQDNGRGITEAKINSPKSLGFLGMRERVLPFDGEIEIEGQRGKGTTVTIRIPLRAPRRRLHTEREEEA
ncbi:MAG: response regulator [Betaproteobacteria bacterium]|nr:response regulator [Betaproteobacteria bacterium]